MMQVSNKKIYFLVFLIVCANFFCKGQTRADIKFVYQLHDSLRADTLIRLAKKTRGENVDLSLFYAQKAYEFASVARDSIQLGNAYNYIGNCNHLKGNYEIALKNYLNALEVFENLRYTKGMASASINIGVLNYDKGKYQEAINIYHKATIYSEQTNNIVNVASCYNNIGISFKMMGKLDSSLFYAFKSLEIKRKFPEDEKPKALATSYQNIAVLYSTLKKYKEAEKYYQLTLQVLEELQDNNTMVECLNNMGDYYIATNDLKKALESLNKARDLAKQEKLTPELVNIYYNLFAVYQKMGEYKLSNDYLQKYTDTKDSLDNARNREIVEEMQTKYETEKKEQEITLLNKDNKIKETQLDQERSIRIFFIVFALVVLLTAGLIYNAYRNKKKANELLKEKNTEIEHQKDLISEKNKEILDSINYAKRLQEAILPPIDLIKKQLKNFFVLYNPKDIVAGDFYWYHLIEHSNRKQILFAAADCTGHGVPGAMVSVVCSNALNNAVKEFNLIEPGEILDKTSELVEATFAESGKEVKDGMDISLVLIEYIGEKIKLKWAGANNPLWLIRNNELIETKADKQPIGKFDLRKAFTTHEFELIEGDSIYLFTDGYADQFGGEKGKKFKYKQFSELLLNNVQASMTEQQQLAQQAFTNWTGELEQVDDVTLIGIRL